MDETHSKAVAANKEAWNAAAEHHRAHAQWDRLVAGFAEPGFSCLDETETAIWRELELVGRSVAQVCCNNGRELLSVRNLGAGRCVGFDQAAAFLEQGRELNGIAGLDCEFVEADVLALPDRYQGAFDRVFTTIGVFGWMPDLARFFDSVAGLLRPGGVYFAYENHPLLNMFEPESAEPHRPVHSYFRTEPFVEALGLDYFGNRDYEAPMNYWFVHRLSDIVTTAVERGLVLERLCEYPHNIDAEALDVFEGQAAQFPLSFSLIARKPG